MLPKYQVQIVHDLDPKILTRPARKLTNKGLMDEGLVDNQEYVNPTLYNWYDYDNILPFEKKALQKAKKYSRNVEDFLHIMMSEQDYSDCGTLADLGVSSTVIALVNLGYTKSNNGNFKYHCIPITSGIGGKNLSDKDGPFYPHVAGYATYDFGARLIDLVKGKKVGLRDVEFSEGVGFEIYTQDLEEMFNFGRSLYGLR